MKKILILSIVLSLFTLPSQAKTIAGNMDRTTEGEFLHLLTRTDVDVLTSIETYLFYSRGINPARTVDDLDNAVAHTEYDIMLLEKFSLKHPGYQQDINKISGYWFSIRNKITHFYQRGKAVKLYEHYKGLHDIINNIKNKAGRYQNLIGNKTKILLGKNLIQAHLLTVLYLGALMEKGNYFQTLLDAETKKMNELIHALEAAKTNDAEVEQKKNALRHLYAFVDILHNKNADPDKVYDAIDAVHRNLIKIAGL